MNDAIMKIKESAQLLSLPNIYIMLKGLLDDPNFTMEEVALLVGRDPGMAARFLRIVNSPLNRRAKKIESVSHAVSLLGSRQVHDIVLCASIAEAFDGILTDVINMKQFWQRSVYCATTSRQLALECEEADSERLFLIGLLHDIGHLLMYLNLPEKSKQAIFQAKDQQRPLYLVERELFGFDYADLAGMVMKEWDLPKSLRIPVTFHPEPGNATKFELETGLLHLALLLVQADLESGIFGEGLYTVAPAVWATTHLTLEQCLNSQKTAMEQFEEVSESVFY